MEGNPVSVAEVFADAEARYDAACERRQETIEAWEAMGKPLTTTGSQGQIVDHPLVKQINALDKLCADLGEKLKQKHRGPDPSAVVRAGVGKSPAAKVRELKAV